MHRIYEKEYNVILRSFLTRAFFSTIVVSSLFACGGVSKEELEAVESEAKAAKEETEKVKKEFSDKITALENKSPAVISVAQYENIQAAVGLDTDGRLDASKGIVKKYEDFLSAVQGSLGLSKTGALDNDTGLAGAVKALNEFNKAIQESVGLDGAGTLEPDFGGSLAEDVKWLKAFRTAIQGSVGLNDAGNLDPAVGGSLSEDVTKLKKFIAAMRLGVGLDADGGLDTTIPTGLAARLPAEIVKGVNALGAKLKSKPKITPDNLL